MGPETQQLFRLFTKLNKVYTAQIKKFITKIITREL